MSSDISYTIVRSMRKTISLHIHPDGIIEVRAPRFVPEFLIKQFVNSHRTWIDKKLKTVRAHVEAPKNTYIDGGKVQYLGNWLTLSVSSVTAITVKDGVLYFPRSLSRLLPKEMQRWYISQAKKIITEQVKRQAEAMHTTYTSVYFSDTISKWGSCSHDNVLQFNWRLVMAPQLVIQYVIIHELAHTKHKNHSRAFWNEVATFQPSFQQQRKWLKTQGHLLHLD